MTKEALTLLVHEMEYVLSCINEDKIPFDGDDFHEALRLGKEALAQPEQDNAYGYASRLATAIWQKHYMKDAPKWNPLNTTEGVLTQIDNMTCGLVKEKAAQPEQEPVAWMTPDREGFRIRFSPPVNDVPLGWDALYLTPPQRTWVDLTDEQMWNAYTGGSDIINLDYAKSIVALFKEKNSA